MNQEMLKILEDVEYATLALCYENMPYSVPVNFVFLNGALYFHGAKRSRKMQMLEENSNISASIVQAYSLIPSYFSSKEGLACPATQFFKSISITGRASVVKESGKKAAVLEALMQKLQSEGGYKPLGNMVYEKAINATAIVKVSIDRIDLKTKLGQTLPKKRWEMIIENLEKRASSLDIQTAKAMKEVRDDRV